MTHGSPSRYHIAEQFARRGRQRVGLIRIERSFPVVRVKERHAEWRVARKRAALSERTCPAGTARRSRAALDRVDLSTARRRASGFTFLRMARSPPVRFNDLHSTPSPSMRPRMNLNRYRVGIAAAVGRGVEIRISVQSLQSNLRSEGRSLGTASLIALVR